MHMKASEYSFGRTGRGTFHTFPTNQNEFLKCFSSSQPLWHEGNRCSFNQEATLVAETHQRYIQGCVGTRTGNQWVVTGRSVKSLVWWGECYCRCYSQSALVWLANPRQRTPGRLPPRHDTHWACRCPAGAETHTHTRFDKTYLNKWPSWFRGQRAHWHRSTGFRWCCGLFYL